jgi:Rhodanese-like domain
MRLVLSLLMFLSLAIGLACNHAARPQITKVENPQPVQPTAQTDAHNHAEDANIARITLADAKKEFDAGTAIFVDTRDASSYRFSRIKGAMHLPAEAASTRWKEIPKGKKIIAYCS